MLLSDGQEYHIHHGDCVQHMADMPSQSVDMLLCSVPFPALYSYTSLSEDLGNSEGDSEMKLHFGFFYRQAVRVMKPGRVALIHVMQIPRMKRTGGSGLIDFRGLNIRLGQRAGFVYDYDWLIPKNPQAQAIRTKSHSLQFSGLEKDRAQSRGALGDYLIKFIAPGENTIPVDSEGQVTRNDWIQWAESYWSGIKETKVLNVKKARGEDDVKHLCPLQLDLIHRAVLLYSNPGEIVFSPFAGIGSEGYVSLKLNRRFYGCEIKDEYYRAAIAELDAVLAERDAAKANTFAFMSD